MNTEERVLEIISNHPDVQGAQIELTTDLRQDLGISSLVMAEIMIDIEDEFDIRVPDTAMQELSTIEELIKIIAP